MNWLGCRFCRQEFPVKVIDCKTLACTELRARMCDGGGGDKDSACTPIPRGLVSTNLVDLEVRSLATANNSLFSRLWFLIQTPLCVCCGMWFG